MAKKILHRNPIANGRYYPDDKKELESIIEDSLNNYKEFKIGSPFGLIMPYVDYKKGFHLYGLGYAQLIKEKIDTIIFISPVHKIAFPGIALSASTCFKIPSGCLYLDKEAGSYLHKYDRENIVYNDKYHISEYSIELQLPYIYNIFKDKVKILPILVGEANTKYTILLSNAIKDLIKKKKKRYLIVTTTNLSQELKYDQAVKLDNKFIELLNNMHPDRLAENLAMREVAAYGGGVVVVLLRIAEEFNISNVKVLKYFNTFEEDKDRYKTSGYLSALLW